MKIIILLALFAFALATQREFLEFQRKFHKVYKTHDEFQKRYKIFEENMVIAKELTIKNKGSARFGPTIFSDLSKEEFASMYLMKNFTKRTLPLAPMPPKRSGLVADPDPTNYDWSSDGAVSAVKDQGQCGSCWAFSATETIESYWFLSKGTLPTLSEEQIVDCDTTDSGCNGGEPMNAYQYVISAGGIESEDSYPYTAGSGQSGQCAFQAGSVVATVSSGQQISGETGIYTQLSSGSGGPVSVCVDASSWQNYQGGVLTQCTSNIDHCVQATGYYNYGASGAYWNVRNSWGSTWGQSGYIWVAIGQDLCAIGDSASIVQI